MKRKIMVTGMALLSAGMLSAEIVKVDLAAGAVQSPPKKTAVQVQVPGIPGTVPQLLWQVAGSKYLNVFWKKMLPLTKWSSAIAHIKLEAPVASPVTAIWLRILDKDGEVLQFGKKVDFRKGGIFEVEFPVSPTGAHVAWGGRAPNKVIDFPARLWGGAVDYRKNGAPEGKLTLLSISLETAEGDPQLASRTLYRFDGTNRFSPRKGKADIISGGNQLIIADFLNEFAFCSTRDLRMKSYAFPVKRLEIKAKMLKGSAAIYAQFCDAAGKILQTPAVTITPALQNIILTLPDTENLTLPLRIESLVLSNKGKTPASVLFRAATLVQSQNQLEALDFEVQTDTPIGVLRHGHEHALKFCFSNRSERAGNFTADVEMRHYSGTALKEHFSFALAPGAFITLSPRQKPELFGHWDVSAALRTESRPNTMVKKSETFAYLQPAGPTPGRPKGFLFGCNIHWRYYPCEKLTSRVRPLIAP